MAPQPFDRSRPQASMTRRGRSLVAVGVLVAVAGAMMISQHVRWRAHVVLLYVTGQIPDLGLKPLLVYMMPGSDQYLRPLVETHNPYAVIHNVTTTPADIQAGAQLFRSQCAPVWRVTGSTLTAKQLRTRLNVGRSGRDVVDHRVRIVGLDQGSQVLIGARHHVDQQRLQPDVRDLSGDIQQDNLDAPSDMFGDHHRTRYRHQHTDGHQTPAASSHTGLRATPIERLRRHRASAPPVTVCHVLA